MGERTPEQTKINEMAPVIAFGGVLTIKQLLPLYRRLLGSDRSGLPASERFFPIPKSSLGEPEEMQERFGEQLQQVHSRVGERVVIVGHSLGGLAAEMAGLLHPDKVAGVVLLAGAHAGIAHDTPTMGLLRRSLGNRPELRHIDHRSDFMLEHRHNVATNWSPDVAHHVISPTFDDLIPAPQGLSINLPPGQASHSYVAAPNSRLVRAGLRFVSHMPTSVQLLESRLTSHYDIPMAAGVLDHVRDVREVAAASDPLATVQMHPHLFAEHNLGRHAEWEMKAGWSIDPHATAA